MIIRRTAGALVFCLLLAACMELDEITVPQAQITVVVHSVINVGEPMQFVVLEESLTGRSSQHYSAGPVPPAPAGEGSPIAGAYVTLTYHGTASCEQPTVVLQERPPVELGGVGMVPSGTYVTSDLCALSPGDTVDLRVETAGGHLVRGTTVIPGARSIDIRTRGGSGSNLIFDRTSDSVWIDVDPISARALAFELARDPIRTPDAYGGSPFTLVTDTMSMVFAGDLRSFEDADEGEAVFRPGSYMILTAAVADTNYYDFARSSNNPFTGRGFINHLQGGVGVFGSVLTNKQNLRVIDPQDDEREGLYRIWGTFDSVAVDILLDLYLEPFLRGGGFSAFVDGNWVGGPVSTSADGHYRYTSVTYSGPGEFYAIFLTVHENMRAWYEIAGAPGTPTDSFWAIVTSTVEVEPYHYRHFTDTLMVERLAGALAPT